MSRGHGATAGRAAHFFKQDTQEQSKKLGIYSSSNYSPTVKTVIVQCCQLRQMHKLANIGCYTRAHLQKKNLIKSTFIQRPKIRMLQSWSSTSRAGLTDIFFVSGSAMTPMSFRSKSPMLRVIASLPLTFGCPRLFHVMKPPLLLILEREEEKASTYSTRSDDAVVWIIAHQKKS